MSSVGRNTVRIACDAMCGGVARWLRMFGVDTTFTPGIDDGELIRQAREEDRLVISSDRRIFERTVFTSGQIQGLFLPVGLKLDEQVELVCERLRLRPGMPRCARCNGLLEKAARSEVGDVVPARSLVWAQEFYRCVDCAHVYWEGSHWRKIGKRRGWLESQAFDNQ